MDFTWAKWFGLRVKSMDEPTENKRDQILKEWDSFYATHWLPMKAAVQAGEMTEQEALRQWRIMVDEHVKKLHREKRW